MLEAEVEKENPPNNVHDQEKFIELSPNWEDRKQADDTHYGGCLDINVSAWSYLVN